MVLLPHRLTSEKGIHSFSTSSPECIPGGVLADETGGDDSTLRKKNTLKKYLRIVKKIPVKLTDLKNTCQVKFVP